MLKQVVYLFFALSLSLVTACSPDNSGTKPSTISLQLFFNGQPLNCQRMLNIAGQEWQLQQFQLYLSEFSLNNKTIKLASEPVNQQATIALLGTVCDNNDQWQLQFNQSLNDGQLSFLVGVPARLNHQDPLRAAAPLNQSDMFWSWQSGYKYLRLELGAADQQWALHLGATGCHSASALRPPTAPCTSPNLARIQVNYKVGQQLQFDLAPVISDITLSADNHCMADPNRLSCQQLLPRLGINSQAVGWSTQ